jgi:hypothetical protein
MGSCEHSNESPICIKDGDSPGQLNDWHLSKEFSIPPGGYYDYVHDWRYITISRLTGRFHYASICLKHKATCLAVTRLVIHHATPRLQSRKAPWYHTLWLSESECNGSKNSAFLLSAKRLGHTSRDTSAGIATSWRFSTQFQARTKYLSTPKHWGRLWVPPSLESKRCPWFLGRRNAVESWSSRWTYIWWRGEERWSYTSTPSYFSVAYCLNN